MSIRITTVLAAAVIALASPVLTPANGNRNNKSTTKLAQFCIPQDDIPDAPPVYC